jgi:RNA polymerase sigma factor (sigma-70 family)
MDRDRILEQLRARIVAWATSHQRARGIDPEDLAQDVLLELERRYGDVVELEDLVPLSFRILDFKVRNESRKRIRRKEDQQMPVEELYLSSPGAGPEERMISRERRRQLARAAGRLKPKCRQLIRLQLEHRSLKTVSELLEVPEGTIYSRWSRCRQALKKLMEEES